MHLPYFTQDQIRQALPYPALVKHLHTAFQSDIHAPLRQAYQINQAPLCNLLLMPVWQQQARLGVKLVTVAPQNQQLPSVHALFILFDSATGAPLALMDGEELTKRRTAAASVLAASYLAPASASRLLIVGNGALAPYMATAYASCRTLSQITVWGRNPEKSQACLQQIAQQLEAEARPLPQLAYAEPAELAAACQDADIICCATTSTSPIVSASMLKAGCHLDLVGGFKADMREVDDLTMQQASVFVDTYQGALSEAGDIVQTLQNGMLTRSAIRAELAELCRGQHPGRSQSGEITLFKSVGTALEDLAAAELVWQAAAA